MMHFELLTLEASNSRGADLELVSHELWAAYNITSDRPNKNIEIFLVLFSFFAKVKFKLTLLISSFSMEIIEEITRIISLKVGLNPGKVSVKWRLCFCILNAILHFWEIIGLDLKNGGLLHYAVKIPLITRNKSEYAPDFLCSYKSCTHFFPPSFKGNLRSRP